MSRQPAKRAPWSRTKQARRARVELAPDVKWAAGITRRILRDCHPWQRDGVIDPANYVSFLVGRGGAKTTTKRARALIKLITLPRQMLGFAAITADHARELMWDKLKDACESYGIRSTTTNVVSKVPDVSFLDTKMRLTCNRTGSVYRLRGVEDKKDAEKFRGFPQAEMGIDECGSFSPELLEYLAKTCVSPRLGEGLTLPAGWLELLARDGAPLEEDEETLAAIGELAPQIGKARGGVLVLGSTPPSVLRGLFYDVTREGSDKHRPYADRNKRKEDGSLVYEGFRGYSSHFWTLKDVIELPNADDYPALQANWQRALENKLLEGWSDEHPTWQREYLGRWSADNTATVFRYQPFKNGVAWNEWNPFGEQYLEGLPMLKAAIAALPQDVGTFHFVVAEDMGSRDPFACNVFAFAPRDPEKRMFHVYAFERQRMYARDNADLLLGPERNTDKPAGIYGVIGWPDGAIVDADQAFIDEMKNVYGITLVKAEKKMDYKFGAIELVNGDLIDGRIKILKGSPLAKQIAELQWKPDDNGNPREDKALANHCLAAGTMVMAEHGERPIESIAVGDRVWTRNGLRRVTFSGQTAVASTVERNIGHGRVLRGTRDHRVFADGRWVPLELLTPSDMLLRWENTDPRKSSSSTERSTDAIPVEPTSRWPGTSRHPTVSFSTALSGVPRMDLFHRGCMSIIATAITRTTPSRTSSASMVASTSACMVERQSAPPSLAIGSRDSRSQQRRSGTVPKTAPGGIEGTPRFRSIVSGHARATSAAPSLSQSHLALSDAAQGASVSHTTHGCERMEPVYDLSVEGDHEFFANGVLVSNSTDTLIYGRRMIATLFESGVIDGEGEAAAPAYVDPQGLGDGGDDPGGDDDFLLASSSYDETGWGNE